MTYAKIVITIFAVFMVACNGNHDLDNNRQAVATGKDTAMQKNEATLYTCPMHHQVRSESPGKCSVCGMDLVPVEAEPSEAGMAKDTTTQMTLSLREQQLAGIRVDTASQAALNGQVILTGTTIFDPRHQGVISAWTGGWIEQMYVRNPGEKVTTGQKLYEIYSPELLSAEKDYQLALKQKDLFKEASVDFTAALKAMRQKLLRWGLSESQIDHLRQTEPAGKITVYSKSSGYLIQSMKAQGGHVNEGEAVMTLARNSTLWVQAQLYDNELPLLASHPEIRVALEAFPGKQFSGTIVFNSPVNEKESRVHLLNISISNPDGSIQPDMLAYVYLQTGQGKRGVVVPKSSILYEEKNSYIWVAQPGNVFERRSVLLGTDNASRVEVLAGIASGDKVVSRGVYLLNSEYTLRYGNGANMMGMQMSDMKMKGKNN